MLSYYLTDEEHEKIEANIRKETKIKDKMDLANEIITKIAYKVGALGYDLLGTLSFKEAITDVKQADLDKTPLEDVLKDLGCVMQHLDKIQSGWRNPRNSEETNEIRRHIRRIKDYEIVSKKDKAILNTWLWKHMGRARRWWQPDCVKLKY